MDTAGEWGRHRIAAAVDGKSSAEAIVPGGALWNKLVFFLETFDPIQMRYAGHEYKRLVDYVELLARDAGSVRRLHATARCGIQG